MQIFLARTQSPKGYNGSTWPARQISWSCILLWPDFRACSSHRWTVFVFANTRTHKNLKFLAYKIFLKKDKYTYITVSDAGRLQNPSIELHHLIGHVDAKFFEVRIFVHFQIIHLYM